MLGRHVYRVHPMEARWTVTKDGESQPRASFSTRIEDVNIRDIWQKRLLTAYKKVKPNVNLTVIFDEHALSEQSVFDKIAAAKQAGATSGVDLWEASRLPQAGEARRTVGQRRVGGLHHHGIEPGRDRAVRVPVEPAQQVAQRGSQLADPAHVQQSRRDG